MRDGAGGAVRIRHVFPDGEVRESLAGVTIGRDRETEAIYRTLAEMALRREAKQ